MFAATFLGLGLRHRMGNTSMGKRAQTEPFASFCQRRLLAIEKPDVAEKRQMLQLLDAFIEREKLKQRVNAQGA